VFLQVNVSENSTLYLEPFVRAFLLGVGSAAVVETIHTATAAFSDASEHFAEHFAPLFYADHATAIIAWVTFYILDVLAISSVLSQYNGNSAAAELALQKLVTLPQRMLPLRLAVFKHLLHLDAPKINQTIEQDALFSAFKPTDLPTPTAAPPTAVPKPARGSTNIIPGTLSGPRLGDNRAKQGLKPGELDPSFAETFARRRQELLDRRAYLHGFWYAAAISDTVKADGKPIGVDILDQRIVLFRDSTTGAVHALDDVCPHRGAPFSDGWVEHREGHQCVVCPYHGWAVGGEGKIHHVPAAEHPGEWPRRQVVPVYDCDERGGFIWLWYGSQDLPRDARPPIPFVPELEDPEWKAVYGEIEFDCSHASVFENALDMSHIHYLHNDSFGNQDKPEIRNMTVTEHDALSVTATFQLCNKPASVLWEWTKVPEVSVTAKAFLPSTSMISFTLGNGLSFITFVNTVPISENKSVNRFTLVRNLAWDRTGTFNASAWDGWARKAMMKILGEDKVMVEKLRPHMLVKEYSVRSDLPQIEFRKLRQQWVDLGYVRPALGQDATNFVQHPPRFSQNGGGTPNGGTSSSGYTSGSENSSTSVPDL
jgi:phenylpropionate dioxygenase-like ring-hydroxylating dioxygenase large terminal subunit